MTTKNWVYAETGTTLWVSWVYLTCRTFTECRPDIVRILFLVPLYATISLASYLWWVSPKYNHQTSLANGERTLEPRNASYPDPRWLWVNRANGVLLPSPYVSVAWPRGAEAHFHETWIVTPERCRKDQEGRSASILGISSRFHQLETCSKYSIILGCPWKFHSLVWYRMVSIFCNSWNGVCYSTVFFAHCMFNEKYQGLYSEAFSGQHSVLWFSITWAYTVKVLGVLGGVISTCVFLG